MLISIAIVCGFITTWLLLVSLLVLLRRPSLPGLVEQRLDMALEVELMVDAIERMANEEYPPIY